MVGVLFAEIVHGRGIGANLNIPGLPPETARNIRQLLEANRGV